MTKRGKLKAASFTAVFVSSLLLVLFVLVLCEVALRITDYNDKVITAEKDVQLKDVSIPDKHRIRKLRNHVDVTSKFGFRIQTNSFGIRSPEFEKKKPPACERILCVGDSVTFGWGVEEESSFPQQLQRLVKEAYPTRCIEVINAGQPTYNTYHGLMYLKYELLDFEPDVVVYSFGHNDSFKTPLSQDEQLALDAGILARFRTVLLQFELARFLDRFHKQHLVPPKVGKLAVTFKPTNSIEVFTKNLEEAALLCQNAGVRFVLMTQAKQGRWPRNKRFYSNAIKEVAEEFNCPVVDLDEKLSGRVPFIDCCHPLEEGHSRIAQHLFETLRDFGLLLSDDRPGESG